MNDFLQLLFDGIALGAMYSMVAIPINLIYSNLRFLQLAQGQVLLLGMYLTLFFLGLSGNNLLLTFVAATLGTVFVAVLMESLVFRPMRDRGSGHFELLVGTIAVGFVLLEATRLTFWSGDARNFPLTLQDKSATVGPVAFNLVQILAILIAVALVLALYLFLHKTHVGIGLRAMAVDERVARLLGVRVRRMALLSFALSGIFGSVGGMLFGLYWGVVTPTMAGPLGFKGMAIVLFAGMGNTWAGLLGALILALAEQFGAAYIGGSFRDLFAFALITVILIVRPTGVLGSDAQ